MRCAANENWLENNEEKRDSFRIDILNRTCLTMRIVQKLWKQIEKIERD